MKLLFVVNGHEYTAAHRLPLLMGAQAAGYDVECLAPAGSPAFLRLEIEGWLTHPMGLSRRGTGPIQEARSLGELVRWYRELKPTLVHHATIKPVLYGSLAAKLAKVPAVVNAITGLGYVYSDSGVKPRLLRKVVNPLYRLAFTHANQKIVFQNRDDWEVLESVGAVSSNDAVLIPGSGVDVSAFQPSPEPEGLPVVMLVSRMLWEKGVGEFVEAARQLRSQSVLARFILIGGTDSGNPSGIPEEVLSKWVDEGVVEWWGTRDDMVSMYNQASLVVLPSYREGMPKVLLEAAACGRAVVSTDAPGCRDAVIDGETGYLVPVRNSSVLAERISNLLEQPELRKRMGEAGRKRAVEEFSTERIVSETLQVYADLLQSR